MTDYEPMQATIGEAMRMHEESWSANELRLQLAASEGSGQTVRRARPVILAAASTVAVIGIAIGLYSGSTDSAGPSTSLTQAQSPSQPSSSAPSSSSAPPKSSFSAPTGVGSYTPTLGMIAADSVDPYIARQFETVRGGWGLACGAKDYYLAAGMQAQRPTIYVGTIDAKTTTALEKFVQAAGISGDFTIEHAACADVTLRASDGSTWNLDPSTYALTRQT
jgi:hypothetical protein